VSLWDLLTVLCCEMPIVGAVESAKLARVGFGGYAVAVCVGLLLGLGCAYIMRRAGKTVATCLQGRSASMREPYFRALYFGAMVWIVFALFLGGWAASASLRLFKI
jgi:hypothetical protein